MAEVKMDLNELKALESKIENLEAENQKLNDQQKLVMIVHKHFTGKLRVVPNISKRIDGLNVQIHGIHMVRRYSRSRYDDRGMMGYPADRIVSEPFNKEIRLEEAVSEGLVEVDMTEDTARTTKDFKNLSEVQVEIREEIREEFKQRLAEAQDRATTAEHELNSIDDKHIKRIRTLNESYQSEVAKLKKDHETEIKELIDAKDSDYAHLLAEKDALQQDYNDLKDDKKRISLEEQVKQLNDELTKLKVRGFWARVFNK